MIWETPVCAGAKPGREAALLGDSREGEIGFPRVERELLTARLLTEFLDKQLDEIPALQEGARTLKVEGHGRG